MKKILFDGSPQSNSIIEDSIESGLFTGQRVMTTMLSIGTQIIEFDRHYERLEQQSNLLDLFPMISKIQLKFELDSLLENVLSKKKSRIRVILFKNVMGQVSRVTSVSQEKLEDHSLDRESDLKLALVTDRTWPRGSQIKTGHLGVRSIVRLQQAKQGFDDVLWVNGDSEVTETTWANVFLIGRSGDLVEIATPPSSSGILEGITRRRVTELLVSAKIPVTERIICDEELPRFDEAFATSSVQGLVPITQIGKHRLYTLRPNSVYQHVARLYQTWLSTVDVPMNVEGENKYLT